MLHYYDYEDSDWKLEKFVDQPESVDRAFHDIAKKLKSHGAMPDTFLHQPDPYQLDPYQQIVLYDAANRSAITCIEKKQLHLLKAPRASFKILFQDGLEQAVKYRFFNPFDEEVKISAIKPGLTEPAEETLKTLGDGIYSGQDPVHYTADGHIDRVDLQHLHEIDYRLKYDGQEMYGHATILERLTETRGWSNIWNLVPSNLLVVYNRIEPVNEAHNPVYITYKPADTVSMIFSRIKKALRDINGVPADPKTGYYLEQWCTTSDEAALPMTTPHGGRSRKTDLHHSKLQKVSQGGASSHPGGIELIVTPPARARKVISSETQCRQAFTATDCTDIAWNLHSGPQINLEVGFQDGKRVTMLRDEAVNICQSNRELYEEFLKLMHKYKARNAGGAFVKPLRVEDFECSINGHVYQPDTSDGLFQDITQGIPPVTVACTEKVTVTSENRARK